MWQHWSTQIPMSNYRLWLTAIDVVLNKGKGGHQKPLAFFLRARQPTGQHCGTFGRELIATYLRVKYFHYYDFIFHIYATDIFGSKLKTSVDLLKVGNSTIYTEKYIKSLVFKDGCFHWFKKRLRRKCCRSQFVYTKLSHLFMFLIFIILVMVVSATKKLNKSWG